MIVTPAAVPNAVDIPLNKLKKSPRNARRTPHTAAAIEALAASISTKTMLQAPVVEPELGADGEPTGSYFVTIGEGRRLAQLLRVKRKEIRKSELVRCVVDTTHDPHEISLDENVTRSDMHPADQFEAFRRLAEDRGFGAEEIAARFGVSTHLVRQRLRLGAVSPALMQAYRDEAVTLDQLMAFAVSEDHARQEQVLASLAWNRSPIFIRRAMTEEKVPVGDRRAVFVGTAAYVAAGGTVLRDLFTEDGGGWFEDVVLLDRLAQEKLAAVASEVREREGWKWALVTLDYPHGHGFRRFYPHPVERTPEETAALSALADEYDALIEASDAADELPPDVKARLDEIDAALEASGEDFVFDADSVARGGFLVTLGQDGSPRVEKGYVRPEDEPPTGEPEAVEPASAPDDGVVTAPEGEEGGDEDHPSGALSDRLIADLTAHRTAGLRDALASRPDVALKAVTHALVMAFFYPGYASATCLDVRASSYGLGRDAPGIADSLAERRIAERHEGWARRAPADADAAWDWVCDLPDPDREALLAHCVSLTVNAVQGWDRRPRAIAHASALAAATDLDMRGYWSATRTSYLDRVTKARIAEAVQEGVSTEAADRITGLKKAEMAAEAETLLAEAGWLPEVLRASSVG